MSDDIVARLRKGGFTVEHLDRAADEIERLRAELAAEREANENLRVSIKMEQECQAHLQAELAALRENSLAVLTRVRAYRDKVITERDALRALLREATDKLQPISALVDMTPSGFPDHDICPIRLGMARDLRELRARIDAALSKGGEDE